MWKSLQRESELLPRSVYVRGVAARGKGHGVVVGQVSYGLVGSQEGLAMGRSCETWEGSGGITGLQLRDHCEVQVAAGIEREGVLQFVSVYSRDGRETGEERGRNGEFLE